MQVLIKQGKSGHWCLIVYRDGELFRVWVRPKLIDVLDVANTLQLHVDNINDLPLSQYKIAA